MLAQRATIESAKMQIMFCHLILNVAATTTTNRLTPQENNNNKRSSCTESCQMVVEQTGKAECPSRIDKLASGDLRAPQSCTATIVKQVKHSEERPEDQVDNCNNNNYNESQVNSITTATTITTTTNNNNNINFRLSSKRSRGCSLLAASPLSRINGQTVAHSSVLMLLVGILLSLFSSPSTTKLVNVKIRWRGPDGKYITENGTQRIHAESSGPHGNRLVVRNATLNQDEGVYQCTISDVGDKRTPDRIEFNLRLLKSTSFKDTQRQVALTTGKRDHINCHVEFDASVSPGTVTWYKDNLPIDMLNDPSIQVGEYNPETKVSQLTLAPVKREHEGAYKCQAIAVTPQLSKMSEFDIQLETRFAPTFDMVEQTIWVESSQAVATRLATNNQLGTAPASATGAHNKYKNQRQQQQAAAQAGRHGRPPMRLSQAELAAADQSTEGNATGSSGSEQDQRTIRVELRCTCQANPVASIMWFTEGAGTMAVMKGQPPHIVEQPTLDIDGHNSTSILIVAYNMDQNWPYRHDTYKCSAANTLGEAKKVFSIVQGNPPPSFSVGPHKSYNPQTSLFEFTLLGPNYDPINPLSRVQQQQLINPPVDAFRIRAEFAHSASGQAAASSLAGASGAPHGSGDQTTATTTQSRNFELLRRSMEPSVQWNYPLNSAKPSSVSIDGHSKQTTAFSSHSVQSTSLTGIPYGPQNVTVNLGKLPSGLQRLYLEAHNAVGWSPNSTHLGDFYLVSGATSSLLANGLGTAFGSLQYTALLIASWQAIMLTRRTISLNTAQW